ncbi:anti-sigma factor [Gemmatimonas groenlandica]|uniref:Anti-sigma factor n=1 Tax=Gemmatimonas groenlandica TaxID=2732249 RepID=A0A6M4IN02_9BACT|nr:anti-sigma factor [Gemmatimonas groenlandica]QJR36394.1 hypothetical protein HKW67_13210 [Gemmatimonas groenlandica]
MSGKENEVPDIATRDELLIGEITAALAAESMSAQDALPPGVAERVIAAGEVIVPLKPTFAPYNTVVVLPPVPPVSAPLTVAASPRTRRSFAVWGGWLAAAAMLALWARGPAKPSAVVAMVPSAASASAAASWVRDSLLAVDSAITRIAWAPTADSTAIGASGDVVWSTSAQRGVMRLIGLKSNDTRRWQYQLWIFDKTRDQRYPVDGGVFDVPPGATEVFVPINARVPVGGAVMFAVTVEAPGGVVVSTRERVALLAAL